MQKIKSRNDFGQLLNDLNLNGYGVELGVAGGAFSHQLLAKSNLKILFSIDRWSDRGHKDVQYLRAAKKLSRHEGRSVVLRMVFDEAVDLFVDELFDFIYVDGYAHTGQEEGKTLHDWWPKLKQGGIFAGHDYDPKWPKTIEEVDKFTNEFNLKPNFTDEDLHPSWFCRKD